MTSALAVGGGKDRDKQEKAAWISSEDEAAKVEQKIIRDDYNFISFHIEFKHFCFFLSFQKAFKVGKLKFVRGPTRHRRPVECLAVLYPHQEPHARMLQTFPKNIRHGRTGPRRPASSKVWPAPWHRRGRKKKVESSSSSDEPDEEIQDDVSKEQTPDPVSEELRIIL